MTVTGAGQSASSGELLVVVLHQLRGPAGLADLTAWLELAHDRLDVEHRRPVDRIQAANMQITPLDAKNLSPGNAKAIGSVLATLREDAGRESCGR